MLYVSRVLLNNNYSPPLRLLRGKDKEFLSLFSKNKEWESSPSILVTRHPNWSQFG
jgi:hypothetical protein